MIFLLNTSSIIHVQIYPSCIQVSVTGSGTALPTSFVSFPGAYTASTPGMLSFPLDYPNIFDAFA